MTQRARSASIVHVMLPEGAANARTSAGVLGASVGSVLGSAGSSATGGGAGCASFAPPPGPLSASNRM